MPLASTSPSAGERDRVGAAGDASERPGVGVRLLVEEPRARPGVGADEAQRRLERVAERAARRAEDGDQRRRGLEALDEAEAAADLRALVLDRERGLRRDREPQLADLAGEREHGHAQRDDAASATPRPIPSQASVDGSVSGRTASTAKAAASSGGSPHRRPADPRAGPEAAAGRTGPAARDRPEKCEREEPEDGRRGPRRSGEARCDRDGEDGLDGDDGAPQHGARRRPGYAVGAECFTRARAGQELGRSGGEQHPGEQEAK